MAQVVLEQVSKSYDGKTQVVKDLNLIIDDHEFVVLVGPSGCGKSTTLRMVAGLESITAGDLYIDGKRVNDLPPKSRDIAMVFQNYALYGHMSVYDNIAFGLKLRRTPKAEIRRRATEAASIVDMQDYLDRRPKALSGGQRQRVALARAIVRDPKVFLFDEPLSNLDAKLRVQMRLEIARLQHKLGTTTLYVTHDQTEAMTMADRIALLHNGELQQFDTPMQLYSNPGNTFVAGFIGSPSMNFLEGRMTGASSFSTTTGDIKLELHKPSVRLMPGRDVVIGIRPEDIYLGGPGAMEERVALTAEIQAVEQMGNETLLYFRAGPHEMVSRVSPEAELSRKGPITLYVDTEKLHFFDGRSKERIGA